MGAGEGQGPLGGDKNCPITDRGTLVSGASPYPQSLCSSTHPNNQTDVVRLEQMVREIRSRASAAKAEMKSYLPSLPKQERQQCQTDIARLEHLELRMTFHLINLCNGSVRDFREFDKSFELFGKLLVGLELGNEKYKAARDAGAAQGALELLHLFVGTIKKIQPASEALPQQLEALEKRLERANRDIIDVKVQACINVCLYAGSLAIPPLGLLGNFIKAATFTAAVMTNDRLFGPSADPLADLDVAAGSLIEACPHGACKALTHAAKQYAGLASALGTLLFDEHEFHEAKEIAEKLEVEVKSVLKKLELINLGLKDLIPKLPSYLEAIKKLIERRAEANSKAAEADQQYRNHKHEFVEQK